MKRYLLGSTLLFAGLLAIPLCAGPQPNAAPTQTDSLAANGEVSPAIGTRDEQKPVPCPDMAESGPEDATNLLSLQAGGKTRVLRFEDVAVVAEEQSLEIMLPPLRYHSGPPWKRVEDVWKTLAFQIKYTGELKAGERYQVVLKAGDFPDKLGCFATPSAETGELYIKRVRLPKSGDDAGVLAGSIELDSNSTAFGAITLEFETSTFAASLTQLALSDPVPIESADNYFMSDADTKLHAQAGKATYNGTTRTLTVSLSKPVEAPQGAQQYQTNFGLIFKGVDLEPGIYQAPPNSAYSGERIFEVLELKEVAPGELVGEYYKITQKLDSSGAESDTRPPKADLIYRSPTVMKQETIQLSHADLDPKDKVASFSLAHLLSSPKLKIHDAYDPNFETPQGGEDAQSLGFVGLPTGNNSILWAREEDKNMSDFLGETDGKRDGIKGLYVYQFAAFKEGGKTLQGIQGYFIDESGNFGLWDLKESKFLLVDPLSLRPQRTAMRIVSGMGSQMLGEIYNGLYEITVDWHEDRAEVQVEYGPEGSDKFTLELPQNVPVFDSEQTLLIVPYLPLKPGYQVAWKALSMNITAWAPVYTIHNAPEGKPRQERVWPQLVDVKFRVEKLERIRHEGKWIEALRAHLWTSDMPKYTGVVWLEKDAPHRIITLKRFDDKERLRVVTADELPEPFNAGLAKLPATPAAPASNIPAMRAFLSAYQDCRPASYHFSLPGPTRITDFEILGPRDDKCEMKLTVQTPEEDTGPLPATCRLPKGKPLKDVEKQLMKAFFKLGDDNEVSCEGPFVDFMKRGH